MARSLQEWRATAEILALAISAIHRVIASFYEEGNSHPSDALTVISALVDTMKRGKLEDIDAAQAQEELATLLNALRESDARIDEMIKDRFRFARGSSPGSAQKPQ